MTEIDEKKYTKQKLNNINRKTKVALESLDPLPTALKTQHPWGSSRLCPQEGRQRQACSPR